ncbi:MAG: hypothetical protein ACLUHE_04770 [Christensenellales bacterium]
MIADPAFEKYDRYLSGVLRMRGAYADRQRRKTDGDGERRLQRGFQCHMKCSLTPT